MKSSKSLIVTLVVLIVLAAVYRVIPGRPLGFAPQIAMALFGGAVIRDKKWAFALPVFSMFLSDLLFQSLSWAHLSSLQGFYEGQWFNYCLFAGITVLGFSLKHITVLRVAGYSLLAPTLYFWLSGGTDITNTPLPKTPGGLMKSYYDGLVFYRGSLAATLFFSTILFGGYYLLHTAKPKTAQA